MANEKLRIDLEAKDNVSNKVNKISKSFEGLKLKIRQNIIELQKQERGFANFSQRADQLAGKSNLVAKSMSSVNKTSGLAGVTILNLTRGINDAKFGFAGLANNLEFVVESFGQMVKKGGGVRAALGSLAKGLLGPIGVVAGISLLIGYGPQIIKFFKDLVNGASEAKEELQKFLSEDEISKSAKHIKLIDDRLKEIEETEVKINKRLEVQKRQQRDLTTSNQKLQKLAEEKNRLQETKNRLLREEQEELSKIYNQSVNDEIKKRQERRFNKAKDALDHELDLMAAQGRSEEDILNKRLEGLKSIYKMDIGLSNQQSIYKQIEITTAKIATNLRSAKMEAVSTVSAISGKSVTAFSELGGSSQFDKIGGSGLGNKDLTKGKKVGAAIKKTATDKGDLKGEVEEVGESFDFVDQGIGNIVSGLASAVGSGQNLGQALLGGIGAVLVQLGGMLIAAGIGVESFKEALKSLNGPVAIAAGIAMVALGAAFSSAASKAGGGGGSGQRTTRRATRGVSAITQTQGSGGNNGRYIGELQLRGSNLVVGLQAGNETRNRQFG